MLAQGLLLNLNLPSDPSTQDARLYSDLQPLYVAAQVLSLGLDQYSGAVALTLTETIAYGEVVSIYNSSGAVGRKANATDNTKIGHGICIIGGTTNGLIVCSGIVKALSGLTPGAIYYLSTTGGAITVTKPATVGNIVQPIGVAISTTELYVNPTLLYTQL